MIFQLVFKLINESNYAASITQVMRCKASSPAVDGLACIWPVCSGMVAGFLSKFPPFALLFHST